MDGSLINKSSTQRVPLQATSQKRNLAALGVSRLIRAFIWNPVMARVVPSAETVTLRADRG